MSKVEFSCIPMTNTLPLSRHVQIHDCLKNCEHQSLDFDRTLLHKLFPQCAKNLDSKIAGTLLASTCIVGMKTPGLHSIYSSLEFNFSLLQKIKFSEHTDDSEIAKTTMQNLYYTHRTHKYLNITTIHTISPFIGTIKAFIRPTPLQNECIAEIKENYPNLTKKKPFITQKALVVGAGSGLGNACAKILLLGGAKVLATVHNKDFDEQHKNLQSLNYNVTQTNKEILKQFKAFNPTHIYYFATPKIRSTQTLNKRHLNEFLSYYIFGLHTIIESLKTSHLIGIFQPSTCFVDDLPLDMQAYTIAKSALETYALFIAKQYHCKIITPRLQKSATNQTLSLVPQNLKSPSTILMHELLAFSKEI